jgi:hypothetical protein
MVYFSDDGDVVGRRLDNWKVFFMEQRVQEALQIWAEPFVALRVPKLFNPRANPFERAEITSNIYYDWFLENDYLALAATVLMTQFLETSVDLPSREGGLLHHRPGHRHTRSRPQLRTQVDACNRRTAWRWVLPLRQIRGG